MEWKIGEIKQVNGEWYQCVGGTCRNCSFYYDTVCKNITTIGSTNFGNCHCSLKTDHKSVIFKKLEKVGEPYQYINGIYQEYKATLPFFIRNATYIETVNGFAIKIKQNKEDMEEKKIQHYDCFFDRELSKSNLKPFDLEAAKAGKPVCTRDGRKARIICFNAKTLCDYPIIALVENADNSIYEAAYSFSDKGEYLRGNIRNIDLVMPLEEHEGWVNIYRNAGIVSARCIYNTREEAMESAEEEDYIDTIRVVWHE